MSYSSSFNPSDEPEDFDGLDAFGKIEPAKAREPLPQGTYNVRVLNGYHEKKDEDKGKKECYKMAFEVIDGPHAGKRLYRTWWFTPKALPYAKRDLPGFGLNSPNALRESFPAFGEEVVLSVFVVVQKRDGFEPFNEIKAFKNIVHKPVESQSPADEGSPFGGFSLDEPQAEGGN